MLRWVFAAILSIGMYLLHAQAPEDSIKNLLSRSGEDSVRVNLLLELSAAVSSAEAENCRRYSEEAIRISQKIGFKKGLAQGYKYLGICHYKQGDFSACLDMWNQSLAIFRESKDLIGESNLLNNIGVVYLHMGDVVKATEYHFSSLKIAEQSGDKLRILSALVNIGADYMENPLMFEKALPYLIDAIQISSQIGDKQSLAVASANVADIYLAREELDSAMAYFENARIVAGEIDDYHNLAYVLTGLGKVQTKKGNYSRAIYYHGQAIEMASRYGHLLEKTNALINLADTYLSKREHPKALSNFYAAEAIADELNLLIHKKTIYEGLVRTYSMLSDYRNAFRYQEKLQIVKDSLVNEQNNKTIQLFQFEFDLEKKQAQINLLTKDKELQQAEIEKSNVTRQALLIGVALLLLLAFFLLRNYQIKSKANKLLSKQNVEIIQQKEEIAAQRDDIESQKIEIEKLMLNILPVEVAQELRKTGAATPRHHDSVTVLFTDFKEFTKIAEVMSAQQLVEELNQCFIAFDEIVETHGLEKIKTIGDAYMCACGIPTAVDDHPVKAVKAALAMQRYIEEENVRRRARGVGLWEIRIGIHTGPVIAGVVGRKKFAYDIWGNAVNIAARLESNGLEGRVNISEATYQLIKHKFECSYRGKIMAKNMGDVDMYFVEKEIHVEDVAETIAI